MSSDIGQQTGYEVRFHKVRGSQAVTYKVDLPANPTVKCRSGTYEVTLVEGEKYVWNIMRGGWNSYWVRRTHHVYDVDPESETISYKYYNDWGTHDKTWRVDEVEFAPKSSNDYDGRTFLEQGESRDQ